MLSEIPPPEGHGAICPGARQVIFWLSSVQEHPLAFPQRAEVDAAMSAEGVAFGSGASEEVRWVGVQRAPTQGDCLVGGGHGFTCGLQLGASASSCTYLASVQWPADDHSWRCGD